MLNTQGNLCAELCARTETVLRSRHYSPLTTKAYVGWVRQFLQTYWFCTPDDLGEREVTAFLSDLAIRKKVSASTRNQALSAILFLFKQVLGQELEWMDGVVRARRSQHLPVVLTRPEVQQVLGRMRGTPLLLDLAALDHHRGAPLRACVRCA